MCGLIQDYGNFIANALELTTVFHWAIQLILNIQDGASHISSRFTINVVWKSAQAIIKHDINCLQNVT